MKRKAGKTKESILSLILFVFPDWNEYYVFKAVGWKECGFSPTVFCVFYFFRKCLRLLRLVRENDKKQRAKWTNIW